LRPIPDQGDAPKKKSILEPPTAIPLNTLKPGEEYDGDTLILQDYLDGHARLHKIDAERVIRERETYFHECSIRMKKAQESRATDLNKSGTSSSTNPPPQPKKSSSMLDILTPHLHGELPSTELQTASETVPNIAVSNNQQKPLPESEITSELCTTIIVHPLYQPDSSLQTTSDTTTSEQVVSEDQTTTSTLN